VLFAINAYVARALFWVDFTARMESIESSYISISRWALDHWQDRAWFPLWFGGMPFGHVYQPGLHLTVAESARFLAWTPEHAYHVVTGLAYSLGPVALFWLCYRATQRRGFAFLAGVVYSLFSAILIVAPTVRYDVGGPLLARRYEVLVHYGEGPHTTALALVPLVIWLVDRAAATRRWVFVLAAPLAVASVVLTNWPGTLGLAMALAAYALATLDRGWIRRWLTLAGIGVVTYLIVMPWASPSVIRLVFRNAQQSTATPLNADRILSFGLIAIGLAAAHLGLKRLGVNPWLRFFLYFAAITGAVALPFAWFHRDIIPQPNRFQLEFDMAAAVLVAFAATAVLNRLRSRWKVLLIVVLAVLGVSQLRRYGRYAKAMTQPLDITGTIEYRMAKWFDQNMQGNRVFAPGNVSLWMNLFTDVPQVAGCCDQGIPTQEHRIAVYTIYTGQNAGERDAAISLLWLKAYGAAAIGVTGPASTEAFKPYWNPKKFDRVLPELWRSGDNVVYGIPRPSDSLAHVVKRSAIVAQAPENGLMIEPLLPLVTALENEKPPFARLRWINQHEAEIDATTGLEDVIFVQATYDPGWHATESGVRLKITPDMLGMMAIQPTQAGVHRIRLAYGEDAESLWAQWARIGGLLVLGLWAVACWYYDRPDRLLRTG
jgi:hypothetical protein